MTKILFYSDVHFREYGSFQPFNQIQSNGLTGELNNILEGIGFVCDQVLLHKPSIVINLGDWFQNTETQPTRVLHASALGLVQLRNATQQVGARHFLIPGNHDTLNENFGITAVSVLAGFFDEVFYNPFIWEGEGLKIGFLPATENLSRIYYQLHEFEQQTNLICTHLDFANCKYESGMRSESKIKSEWAVPIISGDIHVPQKVGSVEYVGSLVQHRFFRLGMSQVGGVLVYDTNTQAIERHPNTRSRHYVKINDGEFPLENGVMSSIPPERCVLLVASTRTREEVQKGYEKYQHFYVKAIAQQQMGVKVSYTKFSMDNPRSLLRNHVNQERPEAIEVFDEILKEGT